MDNRYNAALQDSYTHNYDIMRDPRYNRNMDKAISDLTQNVSLEASRRSAAGEGSYMDILNQLAGQTGLSMDGEKEYLRRLRETGSLGIKGLDGVSLDDLAWAGINGGGGATGYGEGISGGAGGLSGAYGGAFGGGMGGQGGRNKQFEWNKEEDPAYRAYRDTYEQGARAAMNDTMGQAASRTGGMASSYATQAGQASYNNEMQKLDSRVPELYENAYDRFDNERAYETAQEDKAYERAQAEEEKAYQRDQAARQAAAEQQQTNYSQLMDLMTKYGYEPTDEQLRAAGLNASVADAIMGRSRRSGGTNYGQILSALGDQTQQPAQPTQTGGRQRQASGAVSNGIWTQVQGMPAGERTNFVEGMMNNGQISSEQAELLLRRLGLI